MNNLTYSVVRFDGTILPGSTRMIETEVGGGEELTGLALEKAQAELLPAAERYLTHCAKQLTTFDNGVGYPKEGHWINYSVCCCFGIMRSDSWLVDPETGVPLKKIGTWLEFEDEE